jgi:hypothetical protein
LAVFKEGNMKTRKLVSLALFTAIVTAMSASVYGDMSESNLGNVSIGWEDSQDLGYIPITYADGSVEQVPLNFTALFINGSIVKNSNLVIEGGRTYLPLRVISEALGAEVRWNEDDKKVVIEDQGNKIELAIGENTGSYNGATVVMDSSPKIFNGYTYVPARFVSEILGCDVDWFDGRIAIPSKANPILSGAHYFYRLPQVMISRYPFKTKPLTKEEAVEKAKTECIKAYEKQYGTFEPLTEKLALHLEKNNLRYKITAMTVKSESDRFYVMDFIREFWIDKYTGKAYTLYNGSTMTVSPFDPDKAGALAFAE